MYVHVISTDGDAMIEIGRKARLIRAGGMKDKVIQEALVIVQDHAEMLAEAWEKSKLPATDALLNTSGLVQL
ncbi:DUF4160 domain-containing protein, partial [Komagataeibacter europaeus]|uniref:DUF4160 domain-containing protein n=1 Tax=Komagataeibacter europaeus TaxID=33995 RepID=UPI002231992D